MSKNINVAGHISRYEDTDLSQVVELVKGLTDMVERRRADSITDLEERLALLKSGQIPVEEKITPIAPKRTRGGKKVVSEGTEEA